MSSAASLRSKALSRRYLCQFSDRGIYGVMIGVMRAFEYRDVARLIAAADTEALRVAAADKLALYYQLVLPRETALERMLLLREALAAATPAPTKDRTFELEP